MTLTAPRLRVEQVEVRVGRRVVSIPPAPDDLAGDTVAENYVELIGTVPLNDRRKVLWGPIPLEHEMLQLHLQLLEAEDKRIRLTWLDGMMGGHFWRDVLPDEFLSPKLAFNLKSYCYSLWLPEQRTATILCNLGRSRNTALTMADEAVLLVFPELNLRWVIGLPDSDGTTNVFFEAEGPMSVAVGGSNVGPSFEGALQVAPMPAVHAYAEGVQQADILGLVKALGFKGPPQGSLTALTSPFDCGATFGILDTQVAVVGDNEGRFTEVRPRLSSVQCRGPRE